MARVQGICKKASRSGMIEVDLSRPHGVLVTHRKPGSLHICMLPKNHKGKHKCGLVTNEIWLQYCHHEWRQPAMKPTKYATLAEAQKAVSGHFTIKCSCGALMNTCRCMGPNKQVAVVTKGCGACRK